MQCWTQSQGHDQGLLFKDKDKDCIVKDKDQDKDCILVLKESLRTRTNITDILHLFILKMGVRHPQSKSGGTGTLVNYAYVTDEEVVGLD